MKLGYFLRNQVSKLHQFLRRVSYLFEYLLWLIFSFSKFKKHPLKVNKVLIINYGALGDIFVSLRIIRALKANNKNITFYFLTTEEYRDKIRFLEKDLGIKVINEDELKEGFDMSIFLSPSYFLKEHRKYLGYCVGNEYSSAKASFLSFNGLFLNKKRFPKMLHKVEQERYVCRLAGLKISNDRCKNPCNKSKKFVVVHPSGKNFVEIFRKNKIPAYSWPLDRFSGIIDYISKKYGYEVILTGTKEEKEIIEQVIGNTHYKKKIHNFAGKLNVKNLVKLVDSSKLVIGIDTSIIHIAEFTSTPVIVLHGPGFPEVVGSYGCENQRNLKSKARCIKCRKKSECPERENICMKSISIEEVKNAIDELLR